MSTLILGCGYLGLEVARQLRHSDPAAELWGTSRSPDRLGQIERAGGTPIVVDVLNRDSLVALPQVSRIVHCISHGRAKAGAAVEGIRNLLSELSRRRWAGRLVHVSTTGVYGQTDGSWVDEASPALPSTESGRVAMELETLVRTELSGRAVTIRLAGLYGPNRVIQRSVIEKGEPLRGDPNRWLNLIHVEDAANVVITALQAAQPNPMYLACDNSPVSRSAYYEELARLTNAPAPNWVPVSELTTEPNKRIRNAKLCRELGVILRYPSIIEGLPCAI